MGIEWPFGGRSFSRRRSRNAATVDRDRSHRASLPGCMSTLFHFFHFHSSPFTHLVYNKHNPSSLHLSPHSPHFLKASHHGVEAPRNSLELDGDSISCLRNKNENLHIQMGLQIKTRQNGSKKPKASEQKHPNNIDHIIVSNSPSANTPNLLARLMGLDALPQTASPSSSASRRQPKSSACYHVSGTCSLPETPRASSSRLSDVDRHHHRLSLQISLDKRDIKICEEKREEEKIIRRKVALIDITNINNKKSSKRLVDNEFSSKLKNQEVMKQKMITMSMSRPRSKPKEKARKYEAREENKASNNLLNNLNRPTKFSVKKEPSPFVAEVPYEQACSYPNGKQKAAAAVNGGDRRAATDGGAAELKHTKRKLTSHGISMNNPISSPNWFSPSTFHRLKTATAASVVDPTRRRWNRRLLFHMVDEVLLEEITNRGSSSWHVRRGLGWEKVEKLPRAKCDVLGKWKTLDLTEGIVRAVEFHVLDSLLRETVAVIVSVQNAVVL